MSAPTCPEPERFDAYYDWLLVIVATSACAGVVILFGGMLIGAAWQAWRNR